MFEHVLARARKLNIELANGRLAMMAIIGMLPVQQGLAVRGCHRYPRIEFFVLF